MDFIVLVYYYDSSYFFPDLETTCAAIAPLRFGGLFHWPPRLHPLL
jgi:hypothetical protein